MDTKRGSRNCVLRENSDLVEKRWMLLLERLDIQEAWRRQSESEGTQKSGSLRYDGTDLVVVKK